MAHVVEISARARDLPDIGFVAATKVPLIDRKKPILFAPDLAVEVVSPWQTADDMAVKVLRYFWAGTQLVWIIRPDHLRVDVRHPGDNQARVRLGISDMLNGEDVVPGFIHPIADIFS